MENMQNYLIIFVRLSMYLTGLIMFGYTIFFILREFGVDILKGKFQLRDYINLGIGLILLVLIIVNSFVVIAFAVYTGWQKGRPYLDKMSEQVLNDLTEIIYGDGMTSTNTTYSIDNQSQNNSVIFPTVTPTPVYTDINVGGGMPEVTPVPPQVPLDVNVTVIPNGDPQVGNTGWFSKEDLP